MATLVAPLRVDLRAFVEGGLEAGAVVAGAFEVAGLGTALRASVSSTWEHELRTRVDLQYRDGRLDFHNDTSFEADFALQAKLESVLRASLLGWTWEATWPLATRDVKKHWRAAVSLKIGTDIPGRMLFDIADRVVDIVNLLSSVLTSIKPTEDAKPVGQAADPAATAGTDLGAAPGGATPAGGSGGGGGGGPPAGGPAAPAAGGTGRQLPTGRYASDAIPMIWYKPPGLYPMSIQVAGTQYWMTEPDWLPVPPEPRLSDVRRNAQTDTHGRDAILIGVPVNSRYFPRLGRRWQRVEAGIIRTGTKQRQFRRLLAAHGFNWGTFEADHVRDLQWSGDDEYPNLWPLEETHNNAANRVLNQPISYRAGRQEHVNVPCTRATSSSGSGSSTSGGPEPGSRSQRSV